MLSSGESRSSILLRTSSTEYTDSGIDLSSNNTSSDSIFPYSVKYKDHDQKQLNNPMERFIMSLDGGSINRTNNNENNDNKIKVFENKKTNKLNKNMDIYKPPYDTSWFTTEYDLSLDEYIRRTLKIAKDHLSCNLDTNTTKAILVPHAGIKYSGICSASAYYELTNRTIPIKHIILLCNNHSSRPVSSDDIGLSNIVTTSYKFIKSMKSTSESKLLIDTELIEKIRNKIQLSIDDEAFENEHSFYNQLPYIETIAPNALLCPLLIGQIVGNMNTNKKLNELVKLLSSYLARDDTVLICTSDFSHVNGRFETKITSNIYQTIRKMDSEILEFICNKIEGRIHKNTKINNLDEILFMNNSPACGITAIYIFTMILNYTIKLSNGIKSSSGIKSSRKGIIDKNILEKGISEKGYLGKSISRIKKFYPRVSCYYTSLIREHFELNNFTTEKLIPILDITDSSLESVSYLGLVISTQSYIKSNKIRSDIFNNTRNNYLDRKLDRKLDQLCSEYERIALIGLAREQLFFTLSKRFIPYNLVSPIKCPVYNLHLGLFVTIHNTSGNLRGCIGTLDTDNIERNLISNVKTYVISAANDSRFKPITISEFNKLIFSITVLYKLEEITLKEYFGSKFILGRDGILLKTNNKQGYFLPSVATENNYDKKTLLQELCSNKIGMTTRDCFLEPKIKLYYNEGIEFNL